MRAGWQIARSFLRKSVFDFVALPKRTVWNVGLAVNLSGIPGNFFAQRLQGFWLSLDFQNVGDVAVRDTLAFPQPGRNASLGFEAQW